MFSAASYVLVSVSRGAAGFAFGGFLFIISKAFLCWVIVFIPALHQDLMFLYDIFSLGLGGRWVTWGPVSGLIREDSHMKIMLLFLSVEGVIGVLPLVRMGLVRESQMGEVCGSFVCEGSLEDVSRFRSIVPADTCWDGYHREFFQLELLVDNSSEVGSVRFCEGVAALRRLI
ncbi:hypothetical protein Dimus_029069 [Dionaea muscipula]